MSVSRSGVHDVQNSQAFVVLQQLVDGGQVTSERAAELRQAYEALNQAVNESFAQEHVLLNRAKELNSVVLEKRVQLNEQSARNDSANEMLKELKQDYSALQHELEDLEAVRNDVRMQQFQLEADLKDKTGIKRRQEKRIRDEFAPQIKALEGDLAALDQEVEKLKESFERETAQTAEYMAQIAECTAQIGQIERDTQKERVALSRLSGDPERLHKQSALIEGVIQDLAKRSAELSDACELRSNERHQLEASKAEHGMYYDTLLMRLASVREAIEGAKKEANRLEVVIEREDVDGTEIARTRSEIEGAVSQLRVQIRTENQMGKRLQKELDSLLRRLEKIRRKKDIAEATLPAFRDQLSEIQTEHQEVEALIKERHAQLVRFKQEEEMYIAQFLLEDQVSEEVRERLKAVKTQTNALEKEIENLQKEEAKLKNQISKLETERERKAREVSKEIARSREVRDDLKVKELELLHLEKQSKEVELKLLNLSKLYEGVKNQKNKHANRTQKNDQALSEMREKLKVLTNEVEILQSESMSRDRVLSEEARVHTQAKNAREGARVEQNKLQNVIDAKKATENANIMRISKLNSVIDSAEREMLRLRKAYSKAVDARNLCGIQLIDRNDELCILYEKANIHDDILHKGQHAITEKEEEIRFIELANAEIERSIEAAKRKVPSRQDYEDALQRLHKVERDLQRERETASELEHELEKPVKPDSADGSRARVLGGSDPEPEHLAAKIGVLEEQLGTQKERLLEKDLILDEVTSLTNKLRLQAAENRGPTLEVAQRVNEYQSSIRKYSRQIMAAVSELTMYAATASRLQQQRDEYRERLRDAKQRFEDGVPPTDDCEHEWYRMERDRANRRRALMKRTQELADDQPQQDDDMMAPPPPIRTTAEPRPNAYIPDDELGLPKPYGGHAPFKPTPLGANMRHFRNPVPREVEL